MCSFHEALPADTLRGLRNLQRRRRYQQNHDRPKVGPGNAIPHDLATLWWRNPDEARHLLALAGETDYTATYVGDWHRHNQLYRGEA